jgi:hypothetical protein
VSSRRRSLHQLSCRKSLSPCSPRSSAAPDRSPCLCSAWQVKHSGCRLMMASWTVPLHRRGSHQRRRQTTEGSSTLGALLRMCAPPSGAGRSPGSESRAPRERIPAPPFGFRIFYKILPSI